MNRREFISTVALGALMPNRLFARQATQFHLLLGGLSLYDLSSDPFRVYLAKAEHHIPELIAPVGMVTTNLPYDQIDFEKIPSIRIRLAGYSLEVPAPVTPFNGKKFKKGRKGDEVPTDDWTSVSWMPVLDDLHDAARIQISDWTKVATTLSLTGGPIEASGPKGIMEGCWAFHAKSGKNSQKPRALANIARFVTVRPSPTLRLAAKPVAPQRGDEKWIELDGSALGIAGAFIHHGRQDVTKVRDLDPVPRDEASKHFAWHYELLAGIQPDDRLLPYWVGPNRSGVAVPPLFPESLLRGLKDPAAALRTLGRFGDGVVRINGSEACPPLVAGI